MASSSQMAIRQRSASPTRVIWGHRRWAQKHINKMSSLGLHVFDPSWNNYHSANFTECTLKIHGSDETLVVPVQVCTKVMDVKQAVAARALVHPESIAFVIKQGCTYRKQDDNNEVGRFVTVKGIKSFDPEPKKWPHPIVFIGTGYNGIKNALYWVHKGHQDFIMFDRYDRIGGHAWLTQANKTSKLQTEMAAFHVWFGPEWDDRNKKLSYPLDWETWPKKDQVIAHLQFAAERYGLLPHMRFRQNVINLDITGKLTDMDREYTLTVQNMAKTSEQTGYTTSVIYHFPCAYFTPRVIEYPGESSFDGQVGYGMNDDIPFDYLEHSNTAILGNGAFAVENIRTCCEYGVQKVYLVTRRKNLPSPRLVCWFVHQSIVPVPAGMVLNCFAPMFEATGFGDPWEYHSVYGTKDRTKCTIMSNSRFGIGDVTFLAVAWGRCEYVQDLLKRCTRHTLHLESGRKLENVTVIIKALGLLADFNCDRLHKAKEFVGPWANADFRRVIFVDPLGMNAANFSTFSTGIGSYVEGVRSKYLIDYPQEYKKLVDNGVLDMLPRSKATENKPAHQYDSKYQQTCSMLIEGSLPLLTAKYAGLDDYSSRLYHTVNPTDKFFEECLQSWNQYQEDWWKQGFEHEYVPYPYTREIVDSWFDEYQRTVGPVSVEAKEQWELAIQQAEEGGDRPAQWDGEGSKMWWKSNCEDTKSYGGSKHGGGGGG